MLYNNATDIVMTQEHNLQPGVMIHEEGVALVWTKEGGETFLKPSTGAAGEQFAGFAISRAMPPATQVKIEEGTIDSTLKFTSDRLPIAGQLLVLIDGVKAEQEAGSTASAAGKVAVNGADFVFHADDENKEYKIQYAYELTAIEARAYTADAPIGGLSSNVMGRIGYIKLGNIATSMFDPTVNWSDDTVLNPSLGPDGRLTIGGNGTKLTGCIIKKVPAAGGLESSFLVVEMTSGNGA